MLEGYLQILKTEFNVGLKKEYKFFQISDAHITVFDEKSSEIDRTEYNRSRAQWHELKKIFAEQFSEFCDERYDDAPTIPFERLMEYAENGDFNGIIWSGDIVDRVTDSSIRYISNVLEKCRLPVIYCPGNHESLDIDGKYKNLYKRLTPIIKNPSFDMWDYGEFKIITIDNGTKNIADNQIDNLLLELKEDKKILLVLHAPLRLGEFGDLSTSKFGSYFVMGVDGDPENVHRLIQIIDENQDKFIGILAGHVHTSFESPVGDSLMQITTSSALIGVGREIIIK